METSETQLIPRQGAALRRAREKGYLRVRGAYGQEALRVYGCWCWRLKLPLVWLGRGAPNSRFGFLRLDLFTTGRRLTEEGRVAMAALGAWPAEVSPHEAVWPKVPRSELPALAARALRAALRAENLEAALPRRIEAHPPRIRRPAAKVLEIAPPQMATA